MIDSVSHEALVTFFKSSRVPMLVTHMDGKILWANRSFCEWSSYTNMELIQLGWKRITTPDTLDAELAASKALLINEFTFDVQKQFIPKNDKPTWGVLSATRWPLNGEVEYLVCTWEPLKDGTAPAFALAIERLSAFKSELNHLTTLLNHSEEDRWVLNTLGIIRKHPKIAWAAFIVGLGIFGMNNAIELMEKLHIIPVTGIVEQSKE